LNIFWGNLVFRFNLQSVLEHRKSLEKNFQKELAVLKRVLLQERRKIRNLQRGKQSFLRELRERQKKSLSASEILLYVRFIEHLSSEIDKQKRKIFEVEKKCNQRREDLIEATKKRKILEVLKERGFEAYRYQMMKREQDFLNEVGIYRFHSHRRFSTRHEESIQERDE